MLRKLALVSTIIMTTNACTATGGVDWDKVGTAALVTVGVVAVVGGAMLGAAALAEPTYYAPAPAYYAPPITCNSYAWGNSVNTTCF